MTDKFRTPLDTIIKHWSTWSDRTIDDLRDTIAEDCVIYEAESLPYGGIWRGPEGFQALIEKVKSTFTDFRFTFQTVLTNHLDRVSFKGRISGRTAHGRFDMPIVEYWRFRDGKAVEILPMYFDTASLVALIDGRRTEFICLPEV